MSKRLYVGNLAYSTRDEGLRSFFEQVGEVVTAEVIMEGRRSNRSKGFGFVEMVSEDLAQHAMSTLNGQMLDDRPIRIDLANPKPERSDDRGDRGDRGFDRGGYRSDRNDRNDRGNRGDRGDRNFDRDDRGGRGSFGGRGGSSGGGGYRSDRDDRGGRGDRSGGRSYDRGSRY
ncbi:MAG: RNA-binding protein [Anaerolineae bacterium]|nr:RNA-binding protein [Anaerolineae bacterium]